MIARSGAATSGASVAGFCTTYSLERWITPQLLLALAAGLLARNRQLPPERPHAG